MGEGPRAHQRSGAKKRRGVIVLAGAAGVVVAIGIGAAAAVPAVSARSKATAAQYKAHWLAQHVAAAMAKPRYQGPPPSPEAAPPSKPHSMGTNGKGLLPFWQDVESFWFVGYVPAYGRTEWNPLYVWTLRPSNGGSAELGTTLVNAPPSQKSQYDGGWYPGTTVGAISIVRVSGVGGTVYFNASGGAGAFNLNTHTWTFS